MGEHQQKNGIALAVMTPTYQLQRLNGIALAAHWPWIKDKLLVIQRKCDVALKRRGMKDLPHPLPEQIRQAILNGILGKNQMEAYFVLDQSSAIRGFFTLNVPFNEFYQTQLTLYMWHVWGEPGVMKAVEPQVERMGRDRGLLEIIHESPRLEWSLRHSKDRDGYKLARMVWKKDLQ